jgi:putative FmdB family regulatory protein
MTVQHFKCEDCGHEFEQLLPEIEDEPLVCPNCGGLDVQLLGEEPDTE